MKLASIIALIPVMAGADPDRVSVLIGSNHFEREQQGGYIPVGVPAHEYHEVNPGLFLTWEGNRIDWTAGVFRNSYGDWSPSGFASVDLIEWDGGALAALAGLARYDHMADKIGVPVAPMAGVQIRHGNVFVNVMPMGGDAPVVIAAGITFDFN